VSPGRGDTRAPRNQKRKQGGQAKTEETKETKPQPQQQHKKTTQQRQQGRGRTEAQQQHNKTKTNNKNVVTTNSKINAKITENKPII